MGYPSLEKVKLICCSSSEHFWVEWGLPSSTDARLDASDPRVDSYCYTFFG